MKQPKRVEMVNVETNRDGLRPQVKAQIALLGITSNAKLILLMGRLESKLLDLETALVSDEAKTLQRLSKTLARCVEELETLQARRKAAEPKPKQSSAGAQQTGQKRRNARTGKVDQTKANNAAK